MSACQWMVSVAFVLVGPADPAAQSPTGEVQIDAGKIRGLIVGPSHDIHAFKGIPFAAPPVGERRWREPVRPENWDGVRDCFTFGNACPQRTPQMMKAIPQMAINAPYSEDCLYLNVWRPAKPKAEKLPVLVWIHGGGYTMGAASQPLYDGESLASKGVVVVSMNYRLGPFGFLAHPALSKEHPHKSSGNYGILDQIEALRWVQRNIASFGGDPKRVAIFGESAGGGSVLALMVSPLAKDLFQGAIAQSAPEMNLAHLKKSTSDRASAEQVGVELIEKCGLSANPTTEEMRALDADLLVKTFPSLEVDRKPELELRGIPLPMAPIVDETIIPNMPNAVFAAGQENPVPMIIGNTRDEMTMFFVQTPTPDEASVFQEKIKEDFGPGAAALIKAFPATDKKSIRDAAVHLVSDMVFGAQARHAARLHAKNGYPTYRYVFSRGSKQFPLSAMGAHHACELAYLFGQPAKPDETDKKVVDLLQGYWINFADKSNPNGEGLPEWPAFALGKDTLIEIEDGVAVHDNYRGEQFDAVDAVLRKDQADTGAAKGN